MSSIDLYLNVNSFIIKIILRISLLLCIIFLTLTVLYIKQDITEKISY